MEIPRAFDEDTLKVITAEIGKKRMKSFQNLQNLKEEMLMEQWAEGDHSKSSSASIATTLTPPSSPHKRQEWEEEEEREEEEEEDEMEFSKPAYSSESMASISTKLLSRSLSRTSLISHFHPTQDLNWLHTHTFFRQFSVIF